MSNESSSTISDNNALKNDLYNPNFIIFFVMIDRNSHSTLISSYFLENTPFKEDDINSLAVEFIIQIEKNPPKKSIEL